MPDRPITTRVTLCRNPQTSAWYALLVTFANTQAPAELEIHAGAIAQRAEIDRVLTGSDRRSLVCIIRPDAVDNLDADDSMNVVVELATRVGALSAPYMPLNAISIADVRAGTDGEVLAIVGAPIELSWTLKDGVLTIDPPPGA